MNTHPVKYVERTLAGQPLAFWIVEERVVTPPPDVNREPGHLIVVVDASGSMTGDMPLLRSLLEKTLVVEEFRNAGLRVSLADFSGTDDLQVRFEHRRVDDLLREESPEVRAIRSMRTRGLTNISQGLAWARSVVREGETTVIVLMSDGWANDRSPGEEKRALTKLVEQLQRLRSVMGTTIAFRDSSDFVLLDGIAQALSGRCVQASTVKDIVDAIHDTGRLLAGRLAPAIVLETSGDTQVSFLPTQRRLNGSTSDLRIPGVRAGEEALVWRFRSVSEAAWQRSSAPDVETLQGPERGCLRPLFARARWELACRLPNAAKRLVLASRDASLLTHVPRPPAGSLLRGLATELEAAVAAPEGRARGKLPDPDRGSVLEVLRLLEANRDHVSVDLTALLSDGYGRRSEPRLRARRTEDGLVPAQTRLEPVDDPRCVPLGGVTVNLTEASIQMRTSRPARLLLRDGTEIATAAGERLRLQEHRSWTLVADGHANANALSVRLSRSHLHERLVRMGALPEGPFDYRAIHRIPLVDLPVVSAGDDPEPMPRDVFEELCRVRTLLSALRAVMPGGRHTVSWTEAQRTELADLHLSPALYWTPPTTTPWSDRDEAISTGEIDALTRYQVEWFSSKIPGLGALRSANEILRRHWIVSIRGAPVENPTLTDILRVGVLTDRPAGRQKRNAVDALQAEVIRDFLSPTSQGFVHRLSGTAVVEALRTSSSRPEGHRILLEIAEAYERSCIDAWIAPVVLTVGASGFLPESWRASTLDAEGLSKAFPDLELSKRQQADGAFHLLPTGMILAVYATTTWYGTAYGLARAREIQKMLDGGEPGEGDSP